MTAVPLWKILSTKCCVALLAMGGLMATGCDDREQATGVTPEEQPVGVAPIEGDVVDRPMMAMQQTREGDMTRSTLAFPTGNRETSAILLEKVAPEQVRVGQPYEYKIIVTNLTKQPVGGVMISETLPKGFEFERASIEAQMQNGQNQWSIGELGAGESRTIDVAMMPGQVGQASACLAVSYQPSLCVPIAVVQPNLTLIKQKVKLEAAAEDYVYLCDQIAYRYVVANTGSGVAKNVVVTEQFPEGLTTADGQTSFTQTIGDMAAGAEKDFAIQLQAARSGEFTSRAIAKSATDTAYSSRVTSVVQEPKLAIDVQAPEWQYLGEPINFTVAVTNVGEVPTRKTLVKLQGPGFTDENNTREIGVLAPGQTERLNVTLAAAGEADVKLVAGATSLCAKAVTDQAVSQIRRLAALRLEMIDNVDPVRVGENTVYTVQVKNQGSAPATNVALTAQLPKNFEFVTASGDTKIAAEGQNLKFGVIESLAPGAIATWQLEVKAQEKGDTRFEVQMNSDYLNSPVPELEPTRIY